jgi:hypothetical protein
MDEMLSPPALAPLCLVVFLFWGNPRIKTPLPKLGEGLGVRARDNELQNEV